MDSKVLNSFFKNAKKVYPKEYIEAIFGKITKGRVYIYMLVPFGHKADERAIQVDLEDYEDLYDEALGHGYKLLGTIHTHPGSRSFDTSPSMTDWFDAIDTEEIITGICAIGKRKGEPNLSCSASFWVPMLPCEVQVRGNSKK